MKKIKILIIGMSCNLGGIETYLYNLYKNADKSKYEFSFLVFDYGKKVCFEDELEKEGVKFYKITPRTKKYSKFLKDLKKVYKNNNFDYIHFNLMDLSCFERITYANKYSKARIIIHSHNAGFGKNESFKTRCFHQIGKHIIKKIPYFKVACGPHAGKFMFSNKEYIIFNNGIDINKFEFDRENRNKVRESLKIDNKTTIIGIIAKLEKQKNPLFLIDVFNEYKKENKNAKLISVGEGSFKEQMLVKIKEYKIENDVIFLGKRHDVHKIYSAFDIYLMPSLYEGLSISLIEAQVNGLKCYASDGVDKASNITGNVEFISLKKTAKEWAKIILKNKNKRDISVSEKIPEEFKAVKSYEKVFQFYKDNLK